MRCFACRNEVVNYQEDGDKAVCVRKCTVINIGGKCPYGKKEHESDVEEYEINEEDYEEMDEYVPSSMSGDYSPSNPWDAPGMSISDFI